LNALATLGFRGEALPSIAAVADVICSTRAASESLGTELSIQLGAFSQSPLARQAGTTMVVEGLFARFPARRKFLRARTAESAACLQAVTPLALAFPEVQVSVFVDSREALLTPGDGELRNTLVAVLGADASEHLVEIPSTTLDGDAGSPVVEARGV